MSSDFIDVATLDVLSTSQAVTGNVEESNDTSVISDDELVLLSEEPSHTCSTFLFLSAR